MKKLFRLWQPDLFTYLQNRLHKISQVKLKTFVEHSIKYSLCGTIAIYSIGIVLIILRNIRYGLPLVIPNLVQIAIPVFYFCALVLTYIAAEHSIRQFYHQLKTERSKQANYIKSLAIIYFITISITLTAAIIIAPFTKSFLPAIFIILILYMILPMLIRLACKSLATPIALVLICVLSVCLIWEIPHNLGGLGPQAIYFCTSPTACESYDYFGTSDGMLILSNLPTTSNSDTICYSANNLIKILDHQPNCGTLSSSTTVAKSNHIPN